MTQQHVAASSGKPIWSPLLLGLVLVLGSFVVLGDVVLATVISAMLIGVVLVVAGAFEIFYAVLAGGWRGVAWHMLLGIAYIVLGCLLISQPAIAALIITRIIGIVLIISGAARIFMGGRQAGSGRGMVFISGLFGLLAGILILARWPESGLWVIGTFLGIDLMLHGIGWIVVGLKTRRAAS